MVKDGSEVDPAMLTMAERKKLFEKSKDVPTMIARFGESVTPAMRAKAEGERSNNETPAEAWKRKREHERAREQEQEHKQAEISKE